MSRGCMDLQTLHMMHHLMIIRLFNYFWESNMNNLFKSLKQLVDKKPLPKMCTILTKLAMMVETLPSLVKQHSSHHCCTRFKCSEAGDRHIPSHPTYANPLPSLIFRMLLIILCNTTFCSLRCQQWQGDPGKIPKAVLHQLCQRSGWEAPKYSKVFGNECGFSYAVSVLRTATGRGKSRKAGGLITLQLPDQYETFETAEVFTCAFFYMYLS